MRRTERAVATRRSTTSSSAPAPRAACSRTASPRTARTPCSCSSTAARTARSSCRCPRRSPSRWAWSKYDWRYYTEPEPGLGGRRLHTPRGKVLGGSSSINGLVYVRGNAQDFERWEAEGATGWNYAAVLPYFRRAETRAEGGDEYRGDSGRCRPATARSRTRCTRPGSRPARQAGYPADRRRQRLPAGRLRPARHDGGSGRAPLQRGERLPAARHEAPEPRRAHAGARDAHPVRGQARDRRRVSPGRRACGPSPRAAK